MSPVDQNHDTAADKMPRGLRIALAGAGVALAVACGLLWMRFGGQVFLDAALFAWRSCF